MEEPEADSEQEKKTIMKLRDEAYWLFVYNLMYTQARLPTILYPFDVFRFWIENASVIEQPEKEEVIGKANIEMTGSPFSVLPPHKLSKETYIPLSQFASDPADNQFVFKRQINYPDTYWHSFRRRRIYTDKKFL